MPDTACRLSTLVASRPRCRHLRHGLTLSSLVLSLPPSNARRVLSSRLLSSQSTSIWGGDHCSSYFLVLSSLVASRPCRCHLSHGPMLSSLTLSSLPSAARRVLSPRLSPSQLKSIWGGDHSSSYFLVPSSSSSIVPILSCLVVLLRL